MKNKTTLKRISLILSLVGLSIAVVAYIFDYNKQFKWIGIFTACIGLFASKLSEKAQSTDSNEIKEK